MSIELVLHFPDTYHSRIRAADFDSGVQPFRIPIGKAERSDLAWYLETYSRHSLAAVDDRYARQIAGRLPGIGRALLRSVACGESPNILRRFLATRAPRVLTIASDAPAVLGLPWELLQLCQGRSQLRSTKNLLVIRRHLYSTRPTRRAAGRPRTGVHVLFVVSRPKDAGFLDARSDALAVLNGVEEVASNLYTWEFLRPPTLENLVRRLRDRHRPQVGILHFDGHGIVRNGIGELLFQKTDGSTDFVPAARIASSLVEAGSDLAVLSACRSAACDSVEGGYALENAAASLSSGGVPSVLAMTHSVHVQTTHVLFHVFYSSLAEGRSIGEALECARRRLRSAPVRRMVSRGRRRIAIEMQDWFVPTLYQVGEDRRLSGSARGSHSLATPALSNLPTLPWGGFRGRHDELWQLERWLDGNIRRVTITGWGGQGKTVLAVETARWLLRTKLFEACVFVSYARVHTDAVALAVATIGRVLGVSLPDANAVKEALGATNILLVFDNLESLDRVSLAELLSVGAEWSEVSGTRILATTRSPYLAKRGPFAAGDKHHQRIVLGGLGSREAPQAAIELFEELWTLPPAAKLAPPSQATLVALFDQVRFHPLSIRVLVPQLKDRNADELARNLKSATPKFIHGKDPPPELVASLELSLKRLSHSARKALSRLGVFRGGAFEDDILAVAEFSRSAWRLLRGQLETAALVQTESIPGINVPYLWFHPSLAPVLWNRLTAREQSKLTEAQWRRLSGVVAFLYFDDGKNPDLTRAIAWRDLPNLSYAADNGLASGDPDGVDLADSVNRFLQIFGLFRESERLIKKMCAVAREPGTKIWRLAQTSYADSLLLNGQIDGAAMVYRRILKQTEDGPSYERALVLGQLGKCFCEQEPERSVEYYREALAIAERLEQDEEIQTLTGINRMELGDALRTLGLYRDARREYEGALKLAEANDNVLGQLSVHGQLGSLALLEDNPDEALSRHRSALTLAEQIGDQINQVVSWQQLGIILEELDQYEEAEEHFRTAAHLAEECGQVSMAASAWEHLAGVNKALGRLEVAEKWYRRALMATRRLTDRSALSAVLLNLAILLFTGFRRVGEAEKLCKEALTLARRMDPAVEKWKIHDLLARISLARAAHCQDSRSRESFRSTASKHRDEARALFIRHAGSPQQMQRHVPLIEATVHVILTGTGFEAVEKAIAQYHSSAKDLIAAVRRVMEGERDHLALCEHLDSEGTLVVWVILHRIGSLQPSKGFLKLSRASDSR